MIKTEPLTLASAIIAVTRKHMNLETIWAEELTLLTTLRFAQFKEVFIFIDQRYATNFPDSVSAQSRVVRGRQRLEQPVLVATDKLKSAEMLSSAKETMMQGSATT